MIRPEHATDAPAVRAVHLAAFPRPAEADLVEALRSAGELVGPLSMVVEVDGAIVGHVAVSVARPDGLVALGPVAVVPDAQGCGLGSGLVHSVLAAAEALWYAGVVLLGDPHFYARFGFERADRHGLAGDDGWPSHAFLVRPLPSSWTGAYRPGTRVVYPAAFASVS